MSRIAEEGRRVSMLERLNELPVLRGFDEDDETPSSGSASLPTPDAGDSFPCVVPAEPFPQDDTWMLSQSDALLEPPEKPREDAMDSFSVGSGKGSFDSIPAASTDQHGLPILSPNELSLARLPPADSLVIRVEQWRRHVSAPTEPDRDRIKRRRSLTPDSDRRTRPRSVSMSSARVSDALRWCSGRSSSLPRPLSQVAECEPPD